MRGFARFALLFLMIQICVNKEESYTYKLFQPKKNIPLISPLMCEKIPNK